MKTDVYEENAGTATATPRAQGGNEAKAGTDKEAMMQKLKAAGTPGPAHKVLDALTGDWQAEVKCWMNAGGQATVTHGTAKVNWIFDGHFLQEDFQGEMMGKPFTGRWILGYNNARQKYQSVWVDSFSTAMSISEGQADSDSQVITFEGKTDCPASGQKDVPMKQVFRLQGADRHTVEMFNNNQKTMEITYTRR